MDILTRLRESNTRLLRLERDLVVERDGIMNHPCNHPDGTSNNATYFPYLSLVDRYSGFAVEYSKELTVFKGLLQESVHQQRKSSISNVEITSNYLPTTIVSSPVVNDDDDDVMAVDIEERYTNNSHSSSSTTSSTSREIATLHSNNNSVIVNDMDVIEEKQRHRDDNNNIDNNNNINNININNNNNYNDNNGVGAINDINDINDVNANNNDYNDAKIERVELPKVQPLNQKIVNQVEWPKLADQDETRSVAESIKSNTKSVTTNSWKAPTKKQTKTATVVDTYYRYEYEEKGFDVWKKNGQQPIYQQTELYCPTTSRDIQKLKQDLVKKGGFEMKRIENVEIKTDIFTGYRTCYYTIRDSMKNIVDGMKKMNASKNWNDNKVRMKKNYNGARYERAQNTKLFVRNFDILDKQCHKAMSKVFLRFGELATDIVINRGSAENGANPYAVVQFMNIEDAVACFENQNVYDRYRKPIWFGGRLLDIQYVDESLQKKKKKNGNKRSRKYRK